MEYKKYYSSGEFAKMCGVNKRTLHYYNDIGLFQPAYVGENGYHYYSCFQSAQLELILMLRQIGMSIEDVKAYVSSPSDTSFTQMVAEKKQVIDRSIQQLLNVREFLQRKSDKLELGLSAEHGKVEQLQLPEQRILLSSPISGRYDEADFATAAEFSFRLDNLFGLYDNFGSRIAVDHIMQKDWIHYDAFFAYGRENVTEFDEILPAGTYLRSFCIGGWHLIPEVYEEMIRYAKAHHLTLTGYAYEEGLNEMSMPRSEDYITMITIPCSAPETVSCS